MVFYTPSHIAVAVLVILAAFTDCRSRRIPNWLTFSGFGAGLVLNGFTGGFAGLRSSALGALLAFGVFVSLYCLRAMGAGDVKLMAAIGALTGPAGWLLVFLATALAGGLLAVGTMIRNGRVQQTLWNTFFIINELVRLRAPFVRRRDLDVKSAHALNVPYGLAIAAGTLACLFTARI
jgi:prepilin peptidase CpaA